MDLFLPWRITYFWARPLSVKQVFIVVPAYNAGQDVGDAISMVLGTLEAAKSATETVGGVIVAPETAGLTLTVTAEGVTEVAHGSMMAFSAGKKMASREGRVSEGDSGYGKTSGHNGKHSNLKAREAADRKYQEAKSQYDELNSKPNKTPDDKKQLKKLENQVDHWKRKQDFSGENHNQNAKGNR